MKKPRSFQKLQRTASGRVLDPAYNNMTSIEQAAEVPPLERLQRRLRLRVDHNSASHVADTQVSIRPEDRTAFMLGWLACAAAVEGVLRGHE